MGKLCSATFLVALTLLGWIIGTEVEAQVYPDFGQSPRTVHDKPKAPFHPHPHHPWPETPGFPWPQKFPQWSQKIPQRPQQPQVPSPQPPLPPQPPKIPLLPWPPKVPLPPTDPRPPQPPIDPLHPPPPIGPLPPLPPIDPRPPLPPIDPPHPLPPIGPLPPLPPTDPRPPQPPIDPPHPLPPIGPLPPLPPIDPRPPLPPIDPPRPLPPIDPLPPMPPKVPPYPYPPYIPPHPQVPLPPQPPKVIYPPKVPPFPQHPQIPQPPGLVVHATYPPIDTQQTLIQSCDVRHGQRVPCGLSGITANACQAISCCFDGQQCYFGKSVTVQCTKDAQFIVVVAKDATLPRLDLETITLLGQGQGCTNIDSNYDFAIYQFPVTACGTVVKEQPGVIIYENRMSSSYEVGVGPLGAITRDSHYELLFQCKYVGSSVQAVLTEVLPLHDPPLPVSALGPISVELRLANGRCATKGCNEVDVAYQSYYSNEDYPVTKVLRDRVYVEVRLTGKTDPNLILTLGRCWATIQPTPHSLPQWDILINGCPYRDDRYLSTLVPVDSSSGVNFPSHYRRFIFQMFTFVNPNSLGPLKEKVYIHCSTAVCTTAQGMSCEPSCGRRKRDVKAADQKKDEPRVVASVGPIIIGSPEQ